MSHGILLGPGEGEVLAMGTARIEIKAGAKQTGGRFFLAENTIPPGFPGPPPHVHEKLLDMFYILEGALGVRLGDDEHLVPAGSFIAAPPGVVHTFFNRGREPVRFLNLNVPGGWEEYMRALSKAGAEGPLTPTQIGEIATRFDFTPV